MTGKVVRFGVGPYQCAIDVAQVDEVLRIVAVTPLPGTPSFIEGVINLRGVITPVLDLRRRFAIEPGPPDAATRIVVTHLGATRAGLIVDDATDVAEIDDADAGVDPSQLLGLDLQRYVSRVVTADGVLTLMVDADTLLTADESAAVAAAASPEGANAGQS